jgi:hypothetical protein
MNYMPKPQVLYEVAQLLNRPDVPWQYDIQEGAIVAHWKWMDSTFFSSGSVTNQVRTYSYTVTLNDDGTYKEQDRMEQNTSGLNSSEGFSSDKRTSVGNTNMHVRTQRWGIDNATGQPGWINIDFSTNDVKEPLRAFLAERGWTKAKGFFG